MQTEERHSHHFQKAKITLMGTHYLILIPSRSSVRVPIFRLIGILLVGLHFGLLTDALV